MNEIVIGTIDIFPYRFTVFDEGVLWKAWCPELGANIYARSIKELEESCKGYIEMYFDEEPM